MAKKKYELTDEVLKHAGRVLHRIKAVSSFGDVKEGDLGGWVESEDNLSQEGECWLYGESKVYERARVSGDAVLSGEAEALGCALAFENADIYDNALLDNNAKVYGYAKIHGESRIYGGARIYGDADVCDSNVYGYACVTDHAVIEKSTIRFSITVSGHAHITEAVVQRDSDYMVFRNTWSSGRWFTWTRSNNMWNVGCFYGTGKDLTKKAYRDNTLKGQCYESVVKLVDKIDYLLKPNKTWYDRLMYFIRKL